MHRDTADGEDHHGTPAIYDACLGQRFGRWTVIETELRLEVDPATNLRGRLPSAASHSCRPGRRVM
jgi:hypothetical protein